MVDHFSWATGDCTRGLARLTSSSGGLGSVSESPRGRPAVSYDLDLGPRARGVEQLPGKLGSGSESPQGRPAVSYDSATGPRARGVEQLSQVTPAQVLGFAVDQLYRAPRARAQCTAGSTSSPAGLGPGSECPRGRPSVPRLGPGSQVPWVQPGVLGSSHSIPRGRGVDKLSQVTPVKVRGPVVNPFSRVTPTLVRRTALSNRRPGRLGPVSGGPCGKPSVLGNWGLYPRPHGVDQ